MKAHHTKEKFTEVYEREADALFRYCSFRVHDREKAIDIVQDVFAELWKRYQFGEVINNTRAYLFTLAHNRIIDWYRKKKSESLDALLENDAGKPFDYANESHTNILLSAEAKRVLEAIETLDPTYRDALYLRFVEDLSPQEIASILDSTANIVSVRITRGLEKLREHFHTKNI
jgi:RNA polymerase sigma-70 factor (ECF subfamily)